MNKTHLIASLALLFIIGALPRESRAQSTVTNDDFTLSSDANSWKTFDGACLTAGDGTGSIPPCIGLPYYQHQVQVGGSNGYLGTSPSATPPTSDAGQAGDASGSGALRFTNGFTAGYGGFLYGYNQAGSIISNGTPFPTGAGIQVVFKTVTYRGNSGNGDGADGMGFFLMDGGVTPYDTGAFGGSLGYSCSNSNNDNRVRPDGTVRGYDGLVGGYVGLGIDEYGNFLNPGDNTATGPGATPGRIGMRGKGSISWAWLNANYNTQYPNILPYVYDATYGSKARAAVHNTCQSGMIWDFSNWLLPFKTATAAPDYPAFTGAVVVSSVLPGKYIATESAATRGAATPITYSLKITQNGILSLSISYGGGAYLPVITKQSIIATNGALPASFRFGFTGSTGGSNNVHEILCFQATPSDVAGTSVGVNQQEASKIATGTQAYLAYYYPSNNTGRLTANSLLYNATAQTISINTTANWDAECNLTGMAATSVCSTTGVYNARQGPTARTMLTWDPVAQSGLPFEWASLTTTQQNTIDAGDTPLPFTSNRTNYLRGDTSNEIDPVTTLGLYRARDGILGDIVDSSPTWVGPPASHYSAAWHDLLVASDPTPENAGTQNYSQYFLAEQTRTNVVYTGSNDGFLHGFESGSYDVNGVYVGTGTTPNDGKEVIAYMPGAVVNTIHNAIDGTLDYSNAQYSHNFYVDATPASADIFYANQWHTWLIGGLGPGGSAIYALDITNPSNFSESNASSIVKGEWTSSSIVCAATPACGASMGNTYGTPVIVRMHDGKWGLIFGNGFGSASGDAGIFIMVFDPSSGTTSASNTYYLSTGTAGTTNGIAYVSPADLDGDHITDYIYAGDLNGHVWRFDVTSGNEGSWGVVTPAIFQTQTGQPITTKIGVVSVPQGTGPALLELDFGTGRKFPQTNAVPTSYATGVQSLYGVWDSNFASWNSVSSIKYASLAAGSTLTYLNLTSQTLTENVNLTADITSNVVCWAGSTTCGSGNNKYGFVVNLPGTAEQVVFNPLVYQSAFILNTTIPAVNLPTSCAVAHDKGYTLAISLVNGGSLGSTTSGSFFRNNTSDPASAGGETNGTGTPQIEGAGGNTFMITQSLGDGLGSTSATAGSTTPPLQCTSATPSTCSGQIANQTLYSKRLTWVQRR